MLSPDQQEKIIQALLSKKQNAICADCNAKYPSWASLDFGVFVCMNCSGAHRALGPSITRVKSTKLDSWNREWIQNMKIGNSVLNLYWQNQLSGLSRTVKPSTETSLADIIKFVQDKYVKKKYIDTSHQLDPLKRYKSAQYQTQSRSKEVKLITQKEHIKSTVNKKQISFQDFTILARDKPKPKQSKVENLISFDSIQQFKGEFSTKSVQGHKYNHQVYHTASQVINKPSSDNLINFQQLTKNNSSDHQRNNSNNDCNAKIVHQNNFIGHNPLNQHQYQTNSFYNHNYHSNNHAHPNQHYNTHSMPQYDKTQFVTMNINMNMFPKIMNINMAPNVINYKSNGIGNSWLEQAPQEPHQMIQKISLESNIRFDGLFEKKQQAKNWIDDWK